jgi:hypothetical protein
MFIPAKMNIKLVIFHVKHATFPMSMNNVLVLICQKSGAKLLFRELTKGFLVSN